MINVNIDIYYQILEFMSSIEELMKRIEKLEKTLKEERDEYKEYYNKTKNNSTYDGVYIDKCYYEENLYIENLKKQINNLINQNTYLKDVNSKLIQDNEKM